jgi:hypothetical protein
MEIFFTDLTTNETNSIIDCLKKFDAPNYIEIGVYYGGTFLNILKYLKDNKTDFYCCGVDLFEDLISENENYANRFQNGVNSQTHIIFDNNKLNVSNKNDLENSLIEKNLINFELLKGYSDNIIPKLNKFFDVVFIDGNHSYDQTKKDFYSSFEKTKSDSFFVFHNTTYNETLQYYKDGGPYKFCEELKMNDNLIYIGMYDTTKIFKRK